MEEVTTEEGNMGKRSGRENAEVLRYKNQV